MVDYNDEEKKVAVALQSSQSLIVVDMIVLESGF